jgi:isopenicillin-N N-acyltransferase-like protein
MIFPVHRSSERTPYERGEVFGRAQAEPIANTLALYRGLFKETIGADAREQGERVTLNPTADEEIAGIAAGSKQDERELKAANARTEILAGHGPTECSVVGAGGLLAQNWDWHPDAIASTVIWIVEHDQGWFATLTEAGILAKIGLNDAGLGVCLNLLNTTADGGLDGTPIHLLLRQTLQATRSVDEAVALLTSAHTSASSAVTVAQPNDVATVELNPGGANVLRGHVGAHTNHFLVAPRKGHDTTP